MACEHCGVHAEEGVLEFGVVRDHSAGDDRGCAGNGDELRHEQPAGEDSATARVNPRAVSSAISLALRSAIVAGRSGQALAEGVRRTR